MLFFFFFFNVIAATPQLTTQLLGLIKVRTTEPTRVPKTQNSTINQPIPPVTFLKAQADPDFNKTRKLYTSGGPLKKNRQNQFPFIDEALANEKH